MHAPALPPRVRTLLGSLLLASLLVATSWCSAWARPDDETGAGPAPPPPQAAPTPAPPPPQAAPTPAPPAASPTPVRVDPTPPPSSIMPTYPPPGPTVPSTPPVPRPAPVPSPAEGEDGVRTTAATRVPSQAGEVLVRLRDLARVQGVNSNPLVGYGLVVGLAGSGDSSSTLLAEMTDRMFTGLGLNRAAQASAQVKLKNAAVVMVTAELPSTSAEGDHVDVTVSSLGDASSLEGGTLILSSLKGADGQVYATAQGPRHRGPAAHWTGWHGEGSCAPWPTCPTPAWS